MIKSAGVIKNFSHRFWFSCALILFHVTHRLHNQILFLRRELLVGDLCVKNCEQHCNQWRLKPSINFIVVEQSVLVAVREQAIVGDDHVNKRRNRGGCWSIKDPADKSIVATILRDVNDEIEKVPETRLLLVGVQEFSNLVVSVSLFLVEPTKNILFDHPMN